VAHYEPTGLVSGDFFEVLPIGDSTLSILLADVMGHGVQAALVTAMLRALIQEHILLARDPAALLSAINRSLCAILADIHDPVFVTAFAASLHTPTGALTYSNAGHPCPILLHASAGHAAHVDCSQHLNGGVLGIHHGGVYHNAKMHLQSRDQLLIYTDGLFEVANAEDEILGQEGLLSLAAANKGKSGEQLMSELLSKARLYSRQQRFSDDVCLLVIELD
jgi:serine phosphatase RsbU (regulator of sigma subunit)